MNVNKSVEIGIHQLMEFQQCLPESLREWLSEKVVTMAEGKNVKKLLLRIASTQS